MKMGKESSILLSFVSIPIGGNSVCIYVLANRNTKTTLIPLKRLMSLKKKYETYYRSAMVQVLTISKYFYWYLTIFLVYFPLSRFILVFFGLSWSILVNTVFLGVSWSISVYLNLSWAFSGYLGLSQTILGYLRLSRAISGYLRLSQASSGYLGLYQAILTISNYLWSGWYFPCEPTNFVHRKFSKSQEILKNMH